MKLAVTFGILLFSICKIAGQNELQKLPVFKKVTHPFMPTITSEYFFFSNDGLMWFSTAQGLTSFDGSEISFHSTLKQSNELGLNRINFIAEDKNNNFYLSAVGGLYFYDRQKETYKLLPYTFKDVKKQYIIGFTFLYLDRDGSLYAGSGNNGLFIFDPATNQFQHFNLDDKKPDSWEDLRLNTVSSMVQHATDSTKLWVGTFHGIYLFDKKQKKFERRFEIINPGHSLPGTVTPEHYDIQRMYVATDSTIWFNSWTGGIGKYNTHTGKVKLFLHNVRLNTATQTVGYVMPKFGKLNAKEYFLGIYDDSSAIFNTETEKTKYLKISESSFPEEQTRFITTDNHGNLWLLQKGILYVRIPDSLRLQSQIVPHLSPANFSRPSLRGIYFDTSNGMFYAAFHGSAGVHVYDHNLYPKKIIPTELIHNYFTYKATLDTKITKDGSNRLWTAGWKIFVLLPGRPKFEQVEKIFPSFKWLRTKGEFFDIQSTNTGDILLKKNSSLIYRINHKTLFVDTLVCPPIKSDKANPIKDFSVWYNSKENFIYLSNGQGIAQYRVSTKKMIVIPHSSLFGTLTPTQGDCAPTLDAGGRIYIMIRKYGIRIIDPVSLLCIDSIQYGTDGLISGDYTSIVCGDKNYLLLRSQSGIVVYDLVKKQSFLFDQSNGLSSPDNKSFLFSNGYLMLGQSDRFDYYKLSGLDHYLSAVTPYLNSITFNTTTIYSGSLFEKNKPILLKHDQNTLSFSFSAPEFLFPERIEYAYQLSPLEKEWHYTNYFNRKIVYSNLPPGSYSFLIKAQMQGGNWNSDPSAYNIVIDPAWWQTKLFRIIFYLLIAITIVLLANWRIRYVRQQEQQKARIEKEILELEAKALRAQMNPHFIFNCLNSIKSLIQQNEIDKSVTYLTTFSKLIRTLFSNADKKAVSLYDEIQTCKLYLQLESMRFDSKFSYTVNVDDHIDLKFFQVPAMIIQPFIENAIWHGIMPKDNDGHISISVSQSNQTIIVSIEDDGIGREASLKYKSATGLTHQSKGIHLTQSRLNLNNLLQRQDAQIEIIDKRDNLGKPAGTKVVLSFT